MSTNDSPIFCAVRGEGPPAILVHGNPATHSLWRPFVERACGVRTLYAIDLPGFGGSAPPAERSGFALEQLARSVLAFADGRGLERFDLVGHSFGGATAITVASLAPERVRTLTAITPLTDRIPPIARLLKLPLLDRCASAFWRVAPGGVRRWVVRNWTHVSYGGGFTRERADEVALEADRPMLVDRVIALMTETDYAAYSRAIDRVAAMEDLPTLLIGAGRDRVVPFDHFQSLRSRFPRAACHIFPTSGHIPIWEHADETARLVMEEWGFGKGKG